MNPIDMILWPFKWIVSVVLWLFHTLFTAVGMDPASGLTWVLCIIFLTLVMRTLTIPLFVKQIKAMRGMTAMQGDMAKLQEKYKGKKDQLSRQAMAQEQMEMYRKHGTNPFASCLPILAQMPIFPPRRRATRAFSCCRLNWCTSTTTPRFSVLSCLRP